MWSTEVPHHEDPFIWSSVESGFPPHSQVQLLLQFCWKYIQLAALALFRRLQTHLEVGGAIPSVMFAYRRQQPPQQAGLLARWLIAYWASTGADVCIADWDESNAYCNIPRQDLPVLLAPLSPGLPPWLQRFYSALSVYVVTFGHQPSIPLEICGLLHAERLLPHTVMLTMCWKVVGPLALLKPHDS